MQKFLPQSQGPHRNLREKISACNGILQNNIETVHSDITNNYSQIKIKMWGTSSAIFNRPATHLSTDNVVILNFLVNYVPEYEEGLQDHTYECCQGSYGHYPNVMYKRASRTKLTPHGRTHGDLALNDIKHMQLLSRCDNIARCFHTISRSDYILLVVEEYDFSLDTHILMMESAAEKHQLDVGRNDSSVIFSQLLEAVGFIHEKGIVHCNIQSKNVYCIDGEFPQIIK